MDVWEVSEEVYARRTVARVAALVHEHERKARYYSSYYSRTVNASLLLAPISGMLTTISQYSSHPELILILSTIAAYAAGIATSIIKVGHFETRAQTHKNAAGKYQKIHEAITRELALPAQERSPFTRYIKTITDQIDNVYQEAPVVLINVDYRDINPVHVTEERKINTRDLTNDQTLSGDIGDDTARTTSKTTDVIYGVLEYEQARHSIPEE